MIFTKCKEMLQMDTSKFPVALCFHTQPCGFCYSISSSLRKVGKNKESAVALDLNHSSLTSSSTLLVLAYSSIFLHSPFSIHFAPTTVLLTSRSASAASNYLGVIALRRSFGFTIVLAC